MGTLVDLNMYIKKSKIKMPSFLLGIFYDWISLFSDILVSIKRLSSYE